MSKPNKKYGDKWAANFLDDVRGIVRKIKRGLRDGWHPIEEGIEYPYLQGALVSGRDFHAYTKGKRLMWVLDYGKSGAGVMYKDADRWLVDKAALVPEYRGQGIYRGVLRILRNWGGYRILSGKDISVVARRAWEKMGTFDETEQRFLFVNPKRAHVPLTQAEKKALNEALTAYATEGIPPLRRKKPRP